MRVLIQSKTVPPDPEFDEFVAKLSKTWAQGKITIGDLSDDFTRDMDAAGGQGTTTI